MRKEELLDRLDYFAHSFEERAAKIFFVQYLQMIDECELQEDSKSQCRGIIKKLMSDSAVHAEILDKLKGSSCGE